MVAIVGLPDARSQLKAFLANFSISTIIVAEDCYCGWELYGGDLQPSRWLRAGTSTRTRKLWCDWFATLGVTPVEVDGVLLYRVLLEQLEPYRHLTAVRMQSADAEQRFETLVLVGAGYVSEGRDTAKLTPVYATKLNRLPPDWISEHLPVCDPEAHLLVNSMLLARWGNRGIAVGVVGSYGGLQRVIEKYSPNASLVRYFTLDLPPKFLDKPAKEGPLLLLMTFDRLTLERLAAQIKVSHDSVGVSLGAASSRGMSLAARDPETVAIVQNGQ